MKTLALFLLAIIIGLSNRQQSPEPEIDDGLNLTLIPGGTFTMGCSNEQQDCEEDEKPARRITLSDFHLGKYEVTQQQWREIMGSAPSEIAFKNCDQCPVEWVSWNDVQLFLQKLNAKYPGRIYRLPSEAEWEYAARGGGQAAMFGNGRSVIGPVQVNFDARAEYKKPYSITGVYRQKTIPVGSLNSPNALGLHDMSGNVWEWCSDWKGAYTAEDQTNPLGPSNGTGRVLRGGSWTDFPQACRVAFRGVYPPEGREFNIGFRLARTP
jgi:formylglycine-generating enzyme